MGSTVWKPLILQEHVTSMTLRPERLYHCCFSFFLYLAIVYLTLWHPISAAHILRGVLSGIICSQSFPCGNLLPSSRFNSWRCQAVVELEHSLETHDRQGSRHRLLLNVRPTFIYLCSPCMAGWFSHNTTDDFFYGGVLSSPLWCPRLYLYPMFGFSEILAVFTAQDVRAAWLLFTCKEKNTRTM